MLGLAAAGWFSAPLVLCEQLCPSLQSCVCACHVVIGGSSWPTRAAARASPARLARRGRCRWAGSTPESVLTCWGCYFGLACWLLLGRRSWLRQVEKHVKKNELRESPIAMTVRFGYPVPSPHAIANNAGARSPGLVRNRSRNNVTCTHVRRQRHMPMYMCIQNLHFILTPGDPHEQKKRAKHHTHMCMYNALRIMQYSKTSCSHQTTHS